MIKRWALPLLLLAFGLFYLLPLAAQRQVDLAHVQQGMSQARKAGSVGVVMRVKSDDELHEIERLPKDGKRYERGNIVTLIFPKAAP